MSDYTLSIDINIEKADKNKVQLYEGKTNQIRINLSESEAKSIDSCEKIVLQNSFEAIRSSLSNHLSSISREEAQKIENSILKKIKLSIV